MNSRPPRFGIAAAISSPTTAKARGTQHYLEHRSIASTCARPLTARLLYPKELKIQPCRAAPCDAFRDALSASGTVITPAPVNTHCFQSVLATSNAVLCVPATCPALAAGTTCSSRSWHPIRASLTHPFSSGRGLCNARSLRVSEGGTDQIRDPAGGLVRCRAGSALLTRPLGRPCHHVRRFHANFSYRARSMPRRIIAKIERHLADLYPRVRLITTNMRRPAERVVVFYNKRGRRQQADARHEPLFGKSESVRRLLLKPSPDRNGTTNWTASRAGLTLMRDI